MSAVPVEDMAAAGFKWLPNDPRFLSAPGLGKPSREVHYRNGKWTAAAWVPYGTTGQSWQGKPFDDLHACFLDAELQNWGGL